MLNLLLTIVPVHLPHCSQLAHWITKHFRPLHFVSKIPLQVSGVSGCDIEQYPITVLLQATHVCAFFFFFTLFLIIQSICFVRIINKLHFEDMTIQIFTDLTPHAQHANMRNNSLYILRVTILRQIYAKGGG